MGDPYLLAGTRVKIKGVGIKFGGSYYVTEARHIWKHDGYTVKFQVSRVAIPIPFATCCRVKSQPSTASTALSLAIVTSLKDPEKLGRVQVKYPVDA
jgi:hypothetical protein